MTEESAPETQVELHKLNSRIDRIEVTLSHAVDAIEKLASVVNRPQRTDWGALAAWATVILTIGAAVMLPMSQRMASMERENVRLEERVMEVEKTYWTQDNQRYYDEQNRRSHERMQDLILQLHTNGAIQQSN